MRVNRCTVALVAGMCTVMVSTATFAQDPPWRHEIRRLDVPGAPDKQIVVELNELKPGDRLDRHSHPGIEQGYVIQGAMVQQPGKDPIMFPTGTLLSNMPDVVHGGFKVVGDTSLKAQSTSSTATGRFTTGRSSSGACTTDGVDLLRNIGRRLRQQGLCKAMGRKQSNEAIGSDSALPRRRTFRFAALIGLSADNHFSVSRDGGELQWWVWRRSVNNLAAVGDVEHAEMARAAEHGIFHINIESIPRDVDVVEISRSAFGMRAD